MYRQKNKMHIKIYDFCNNQLIHFHCSVKQTVKAKLLNLQVQDEKKESYWLMRNLQYTDGCNTPVLMGGLVSHITIGLCGFPSTFAPYIMLNVTAILFLATGC